MADILHGMENPEGAAANGLEVAPREVTILLADLRGFTALSGSQPASVVIAALNRCLARLSEVVFKYQGTIDKFMGDSIMVLFGAPVAREDDVDRALLCAVEMQIAMRELVQIAQILLPDRLVITKLGGDFGITLGRDAAFARH